MRYRIPSIVATLGVLATVAGCTISKVEPPPVSGPSELALSIQMTANPSVLRQDGASQSLIRIQARGPNGEPARSVALRAEIAIGGIIADFGRLSARDLVTDNSGLATLIYTAPPFVGEPVDEGIFVTILVTPAETDYRNAFSRQLDIRLVPPGVIMPPNDGPTAKFTFTPTFPQVLQNVVFDASASDDPDGIITSWVWDFGDGSGGSGRIAQHEYRHPSTFSVTLTVTDDRGKSAQASDTITVAAGAPPTAAFTFSPTAPLIHQNIVFNAAASKAAPGRTIVSYEWNFGSGDPASGVVANKSYDTAGTYNVTLTVTDDAGQQATATLAVTVNAPGAPPPPVAAFSVSKIGGNSVIADASASSSPSGAALTYRFSWGDNNVTGPQASPTATHDYTPLSGTFTITLTVTDSNGRSATATQSVTVP